MSVDYHALLWQQLNKSFATGTDQVFVMSLGKFLLYSDYTLKNKLAGWKTFELTNDCIGCGPNYNPTGEKISILWDTLLNKGEGPEAGPEQKPAFDNAKSALYKVWKNETPTPYYQRYLDAKSAYLTKKNDLEHYYKDHCGDGWKAEYDKAIKATPEYLTFERLDKNVAPMLKAIDVWRDGPLADVLAPMKKGMHNHSL